MQNFILLYRTLSTAFVNPLSGQVAVALFDELRPVSDADGSALRALPRRKAAAGNEGNFYSRPLFHRRFCRTLFRTLPV